MSEQGDKNKQLSPTICLLPVSSISIHATGKIVRCQMSETPMGDVSEGSIIQQWDNEKFQQLRQTQLDGDWLRGCDNCKIKEEKNVVSKRQHWMTLDLFDDVWEKVDWQKKTGNKIYHLDIAFNNICNFKCMMCSSAYSNAWIGDEEKLKEKGFNGSSGHDIRTSSTWNRQKWTLSSQQLEEVIDNAPDLRRVEILGGEPFLVPEFLEFLKLLRDRGLDKNIELMITTNGSVVTEEKLELLEGFKYVNINLSLDGTGAYFSYLRSAGWIDWQGIVEKATMIKEWCDRPRPGQYKLNINGTFQLINILNLREFIEFIIKFYGWDKNDPVTASKNRHSFEHRILVGPKMLKADWAPVRLVDAAIDQIDSLIHDYPFLSRITERRYLNDIRTLLMKIKSDTHGDAEEYRKNFVTFIKAIDFIRKNNIVDVAPELAKELFNE
jgi:radical SAM protein with 4Fe4S-binding SPASM domain